MTDLEILGRRLREAFPAEDVPIEWIVLLDRIEEPAPLHLYKEDI